MRRGGHFVGHMMPFIISPVLSISPLALLLTVSWFRLSCNRELGSVVVMEYLKNFREEELTRLEECYCSVIRYWPK